MKIGAFAIIIKSQIAKLITNKLDGVRNGLALKFFKKILIFYFCDNIFNVIFEKNNFNNFFSISSVFNLDKNKFSKKYSQVILPINTLHSFYTHFYFVFEFIRAENK